MSAPIAPERLIAIEAADDPRTADYVDLRDAHLRRSLEAEQGLFIAEGEKVIRRAVDAGFEPRSFLLAERWLEPLTEVINQTSAPVYLVTEQLAESITGFHVHRGALASVRRTTRHQPADLLGADRLVVCEDIVDHANVGAILRCAAGLGWDGVLLSPRCADPLYRRAIKVGMGAVFSLPWARLPDWNGAVPALSAAGFRTVALALRDDAVELAQVAAQVRADHQRVAILVGTEGEGLSGRWIEAADVVARIPMSAGIDSLNVAAATAIACYELRR